MRWIALLLAVSMAPVALAGSYLIPKHPVQGFLPGGGPPRLYTIDAETLHREGDIASADVWVDRETDATSVAVSQRTTYNVDCRQRRFRPHNLQAFDRVGTVLKSRPGTDVYMEWAQGSIHEIIAQIVCAPSLEDQAVAELFERVDVPDRRTLALTRLVNPSIPSNVERPAAVPDARPAAALDVLPLPGSDGVRDVSVPELLALARTAALIDRGIRVRVQGRLSIPSPVAFQGAVAESCWLFERPNQGGGAYIQLLFDEGTGPNRMRELPFRFRASDLSVTAVDGRKLGHGAFVVAEGTLESGGVIALHVTSIRSASPERAHAPAAIAFESARRHEMRGSLVSVRGRLDLTRMSNLGDALYEFRMHNPAFGPNKVMLARLNVGNAANTIAHIPNGFLNNYYDFSVVIRDRRGAEVPHGAQLLLTGVLDDANEADGELGTLYVESIERVAAPRARARRQRPAMPQEVRPTGGRAPARVRQAVPRQPAPR